MSEQEKKPHELGLGLPSANVKPANPNPVRRKGGPATDFGRRESSYNRFTHGIRSDMVILPGENPKEYDAFRTELLKDLTPQGMAEGLAADSIVAAAWRLRRLGRIESEMFKFLYDQDLVGRIEQRAGRIPDTTVRLGSNVHYAAQRGLSMKELQRHETHIERLFFAALAELRRLQSSRPKAEESQDVNGGNRDTEFA